MHMQLFVNVTRRVRLALAREFLMLGRDCDAAELVRLGVIGRAVPRADLDPSVDEVVRALADRHARLTTRPAQV